MKNIAIFTAALFLVGCDDVAHREQWVAQCAKNEFTPKQCLVLYSMVREHGEDALLELR